MMPIELGREDWAARAAGQAPVVTIGIPTYNRAESLRRALDSALSQSEQDIEVIVSDDGSTDLTPRVVQEIAARDARVRYLRHSANRGLTANFNTVLQLAKGRYVMVLADDDRLDDDYVARCRRALDRDDRLVLVSGGAVYHEPGGGTFAGRDINLLDADPARRVRRYFASVTDNVCIYGLIRRSMIEAALPMRNCLAGDWLLIARLAFLGTVRTDPHTHVHRSTDGTSANFQRTVTRMRLSAFEDRHPHLSIMRFIWNDISHDSAVYGSLTSRKRHVLGLLSAMEIVRTRPLGLLAEELPLLRAAYRRIVPLRPSADVSIESTD